MSDVLTTAVWTINCTSEKKLLLLGLADNAADPNKSEVVYFDDSRLPKLATKCSFSEPRARAILGDLRAAGLIEDGPAPSTLRLITGEFGGSRA